MKRRRFIKNSIIGTLGIGLMPSRLLSSRNCNPTYPDILGPYWSNNHPQRTVLANSSEPGIRINISGVVTTNDCQTPIENAIVDVWHANDQGCYTIFQECESGNLDNDPYNLRGIMVTDENGQYAFESVLPGYYSGRPRHFHYKITTPSGLELVTQCYFQSDPFTDEEWEDNHPGLVIELEETGIGLTGIFDIVMDEEVQDVNIDKNAPTLPDEFTVEIAYPNPFNNEITIDYTIYISGYVEITIYDILGKWVTTLVKENMKKGKHTITWRGDDMFGNLVASGSYLVLVKFGNSIQSRKIKLVK